MTDLIDRQMAIQKMRDLYSEDLDAYGVEIPEMFDCDRAIEALQNLPSAEPEIIYCKDCDQYNPEAQFCDLVQFNFLPEGHCSWGRRKEKRWLNTL